mgnify:CR=1 FL=1
MNSLKMKNMIIVGVVLAIITAAATATLIYAQGLKAPSNNSGYAEPLRGRWGYLIGNTTKEVVPKHLMYLWRFRWGWGAIKPQTIEISEEYKKKVVDILEKDSDTRALIKEGYNITLIRPLIKVYVKGDGSVEFRATQALVRLHKNGEGTVLVLVDIEEGKVLKILQFRVIEKG